MAGGQPVKAKSPSPGLAANAVSCIQIMVFTDRLLVYLIAPCMDEAVLVYYAPNSFTERE